MLFSSADYLLIRNKVKCQTHIAALATDLEHGSLFIKLQLDIGKIKPFKNDQHALIHDHRASRVNHHPFFFHKWDQNMGKCIPGKGNVTVGEVFKEFTISGVITRVLNA